VALNLLLAAALLGGDEAIEAGQKLRLRERRAVFEIEMLTGAPEAPCHRDVGRAACSTVSNVPRVRRMPPTRISA
jgi:hypothetical protein